MTLESGDTFFEFLSNVLNEEYRIGLDQHDVQRYNFMVESNFEELKCIIEAFGSQYQIAE